MTARLVEQCDACGSVDLASVLSLGHSPATCAMRPVADPMVSETHYPLDLLFCERCAHGQLSVIVDPKVVFPATYPYSSGNSNALHANFQDLADRVTEYMDPWDLVVDIGANDGTLLRKFERARTVGVEPTRQAEKIPGVIYREFFSESVAHEIVRAHGQAKVVTACNVMAHVADLEDVMAGIKILLAPDGVFVAENHDLAKVAGGQWDVVYHEHLRFFSPHSFSRMLTAHGFAGGWCQRIPTHGGSFRMLAAHEKNPITSAFPGPVEKPEFDWSWLRRLAAAARERLRAVATGGDVWGIGATARATTIINYAGLDVEDVDCVAEVPGSDKIGHYIPGTRIPVVDEHLLYRDKPERAILFSWHLADVIVPKLRERGYEGTVILPLELQHA